MQKNIICILLLIFAGSLLAISPRAAVIGQRAYSASELKKGFDAYLEYHKMPAELSAADSLKYYEQYFDELVAVYIYSEATIKRGIEVSAAELEASLLSNPPQGLRQIPDFQSDGKFDIRKLETALAKDADFKEEVLGIVKDMSLYRKLLEDVKNEVTVDADSLRNAWLAQSQSADAQIIYFDYTKYQDIVASEAEVQALYDEIKEKELKKEDGRSLYYVMFPGASSRATATAAALDKAAMDSRALHNLAKEQGLQKAAKGLKYELKESLPFSKTDAIIRGIGREPALVAQSFFFQPGMLLDIHKNMVGDIFICEIAQHHEVYYEDFKVVEAILKYRANSRKRSAKNREIVEEFTRKYPPEAYFEAAEQEGISIVQQENITLHSSFAPIGEILVLNQAILNTPVGEQSPLIENMGMYYIARVLSRQPNDPKDWDAVKDQVYSQALAEAQNRHLDEWFLAEKAKVYIQK